MKIAMCLCSGRWAHLAVLASLAAVGCVAEVEGETGAPTSAQQALAAPKIPDTLAVPDGYHHAFTLPACGDQVYRCDLAADGTYAWTFVEPSARLFTRHGALAGIHYAGPTWEALDGSAVVAERVAGETVDAHAIPWLLLRATSHEGKGRMAKIAYVQRVATRGGLAPETGCDAAHVGATAEVAYRADYVFYR